MYTIATLNKISQAGLSLLSEKYDIAEDVNNAEGIVVRSADMHTMDFSEKLLGIARAGAGVNNIPVDKCSEKGIVVFNSPGANANAVKELVLAGLFLSSRNIVDAVRFAKTLTSDVAKEVEKNKSKFAGNELKGKTLGVIGLGAIGVMVANAASSLGMKVFGYDPYISVKAALGLSRKIKLRPDLDVLLAECDFITVHIPFMDDTNKLLNEDKFSLMKEGASILNFSRDKIVSDKDIMTAIESGKIKNYVTDFPNDTLLGSKGVIKIPHLGASTEESEDNCAIMAVEQLMDYIENGNIANSVNFPNCSLGSCNSTCRLTIMNKNIPAMLGKITSTLADMNINISEMTNKSKGDYAYNILDLDTDIDILDINRALDFEGIVNVRIIK